MLLISDYANLEVGTGVVGKSNSSNETLVLLRVVILKSDLELYGLGEFTLLHVLSELNDCLSNLGVVNLCGHLCLFINNKY